MEYNFKYCYPDANEFKDVIKLKKFNEWNIEYVKLTDTVGYWIADNPFLDDGFNLYKELVSCFPIVKTHNNPQCKEPNPFESIHLPEWMCKEIFLLIKEYFEPQFSSYYNMQFTEWGNVYFKEKCKPLEYFRLPHMDFPCGIVANFWFSDHEEGTSGTSLYEYKGKTYRGDDNKMYFDFQVDKSHPRFNECKELFLDRKRLSEWKNMGQDEYEYWGFEPVGIAPSIQSKMTLYNSHTPHSPYIDSSVDFRWSHTYAISYIPML
jgi:hypothetical protein